MKKRVSHFIYGTGIIIAEDKKTVTIDFNGTIKKFSLFYSGTI